MELFYRQITPDLWGNCEKKIKRMNPDPITKDLYTKDSTLSLWYGDDPKDVALAVVTNRSKVEDLFLLSFDKRQLRNWKIKQVNGNTNYKAFKKNHYDIMDLTLWKLSKFAAIIIKNLKNEYNIIPFTKDELLKIIIDGINSNKLDIDNLSPEFKKNHAADLGLSVEEREKVRISLEKTHAKGIERLMEQK